MNIREPRAAAHQGNALQPEMTDMTARSNQTLIHHLRELIAALERRKPCLDREWERDITRDADGLRHAALRRIGELEQSPCAAACAADQGIM